MQPRPYQIAFIENVEKGWKEFSKQLGVAPTGSGKTIIFSHLAKRLNDTTGKRTLILAHREELIDQAITKLHSATGIIAQKEKAEFNASLMSPVVVASIQTMIRRLPKWPADHFGLIVCDEAHHSISDSWQTVLNHFTGKVLGVTATPDRGDKRSLGNFYENIAHEISLIELIKDGYLSPITIRSLPLRIDLSHVGSTAGDFDSSELGNALEPYLGQIAVSLREAIGQRKTLCFLPLIATSKSFVDACQTVGIAAGHVDGESDDRKEKLAAFERGEFQILSNAMLLTEGYDCPQISCVVNLRPTRSRSLYAQIAGRGTRIAEGKENLLLLDFLFQHERHKICKPASLIAKNEEEAEAISKLAEEKAEATGYGDDQLDLMDLVSQVEHTREKALRERLEQLAKRKAKYISAEEFALQHQHMEIAEFEPTMKWHEEPATAKQVEWIEKAGIDPETVRGKGHASAVLDVFFKVKNTLPASDKVKKLMRWKKWRSIDNLRGADLATQADARDFFASGVMKR